MAVVAAGKDERGPADAAANGEGTSSDVGALGEVSCGEGALAVRGVLGATGHGKAAFSEGGVGEAKADDEGGALDQAPDCSCGVVTTVTEGTPRVPESMERGSRGRWR